MRRMSLALALACFIAAPAAFARKGEKVKDRESGVEIFLPDGMSLKKASPERVVLSGDDAEIFSIIVIVEVDKLDESDDLDSLFDDLGGDLRGPKKIKGWICGDKIERRPGKGQKEEVAVGRCVGHASGRNYISATVRGTPEHYENFGGLPEVAHIAASFKVDTKRRR